MASRNKKIRIPPSVIGWAAVFFLTGAGIFAFSRHIMNFIKTSDFFTVNEIWYESSLRFMETNEIKGLKGRNIFDVDLSRAERQLQARYPQFARLRVLRRFPNQILVVARERMPFVQVQLNGKAATLDEKGVILSITGNPDGKLPLVIGTGSSKKQVMPGLPMEGQDIKVALNLVKYSQEDKVLAQYPISKIDVSNLSQTCFYILNGLKVIVDQEKLSHQLKMLGLVLAQAKIDTLTVKYIDLRFKEPILGKK